MTSKYWIKLFIEVLDDPKVARLPDNLWRRFFECCLLAGEVNNGGRLPPPGEIAWRLRLGEETLLREFSQLDDLGLLTYRVENVLDEGHWVVTNFTKRQAPIKTIERVRRHRARKLPSTGAQAKVEMAREASGNEAETERENPCNENETERMVLGNECTTERVHSGNVIVTNRYIDIDTDIDTDIEPEVESDPKGESRPPPSRLSRLSLFFVNLTGIPELTGGAPRWVEAIQAWIDAGIEEQDLEAAFKLLLEKNYTVSGPWSLTNTAIGMMAKRRSKMQQEDVYEKAGYK